MFASAVCCLSAYFGGVVDEYIASRVAVPSMESSYVGVCLRFRVVACSSTLFNAGGDEVEGRK